MGVDEQAMRRILAGMVDGLTRREITGRMKFAARWPSQ